MRYWVKRYIVCKCINNDQYKWVSFRGWLNWSFCVKWDSMVESKTLSFKVLFFCDLLLIWVRFLLNWQTKQSLKNTLIHIGALGKWKLWIQLEYVFSDPECPLVCRICEVMNAINIIHKGRQGNLKAGAWYSKITVFSFDFCEVSKECFSLRLWYQLW